MWRVNVALPHGLRVTVSSGALFWLFACMAVALLLWAFVSVLQQGLARGDRLRAEQRLAATQPSHKAVVRTAQLAPADAKP